ncbi:hypothetical protein HOR63_gp14 [Escherichia phage vB_EcoS_CEB_EC3a]|uniref:Putative membrane protein n=1 Tax=Escherichia phage vB_EcoS_CEB_EC3a TaxID=1933774 RepID=A0A1Q1PWE9_9CAUD|nr:hypothetical protein HOR63_gp14 [Escherichia phage vB_EcoS_CEB_EC3a]AQN32417.1 putative membrane protein [Escherichia phage vB_EcoS_CEB_EC3a]
MRSAGFGFGYVNHCGDYDDVGVCMSELTIWFIAGLITWAYFLIV